MISKLFPSKLSSPHIPLGITETEGLGILRSVGEITGELNDGSLSVRTRSYRAAIYVTDGIVTSVWFDDPAGRLLSRGKAEKMKLYLKRYGNIQDWEMRLDNGWMHYWFNDKEGTQMVYGLHKDVIRFNLLKEPTNT